MITHNKKVYEKEPAYRWYIVMHNVSKYFEPYSEFGCDEESRQVMYRYCLLEDALRELRTQRDKAYNDVHYMERHKTKADSAHYIELSGFNDCKDNLHTIQEFTYEYTHEE